MIFTQASATISPCSARPVHRCGQLTTSTLGKRKDCQLFLIPRSAGNENAADWLASRRAARVRAGYFVTGCIEQVESRVQST